MAWAREKEERNISYDARGGGVQIEERVRDLKPNQTDQNAACAVHLPIRTCHQNLASVSGGCAPPKRQLALLPPPRFFRIDMSYQNQARRAAPCVSNQTSGTAPAPALCWSWRSRIDEEGTAPAFRFALAPGQERRRAASAAACRLELSDRERRTPQGFC